MTIVLVMAGAGGGVLRGLFGIAKDVALKKNLEINWPWFGVSVAISAIVGVVAASFFNEDLRLAFLAGYVGADFIEGLMKIKLNTMFGSKSQEEKEEDKTKKTAPLGSLLDLIRK